MSLLFGRIILRDVPKEIARIDGSYFPIEGGFRGFRNVLPGPHWAGVLSGERERGFWCVLDAGGVHVRRFDDDREAFAEPDEEGNAQIVDLANSGAMDAVLIPYPPTAVAPWAALTSHLDTGLPRNKCVNTEAEVRSRWSRS